MKLSRPVLIPISLIGCALLAACSGSATDTASRQPEALAVLAGQGQQTISAPARTDFPDLPPPSSLETASAPRQISAAGDSVFIAGEDYSEALPSQNASTFNGSVFLDGGWATSAEFADLGYVCFDFNITGLEPAARVRVDWVLGSHDQNIYVALAKFELDRWSWFRPSGGSSVELESLTPFTDENGRVIVLVLNASAELQETNYVQLAGVSIGSHWDSHYVAPFGEVGLIQQSDMELAAIGGRPALAYEEEEGDEEYYVRYVRALDDAGTQWTEPLDLLGPLPRNSDFSLLEVNGRPALAYRELSFLEEIEQNVSSLYYMRAQDAEGSSWGAPVLVDPGGEGTHGQSPFLCIVNGHPAMSYRNEDSESFSEGLMYVRALDADGMSWGEPVVAAPPINFGYGLYDAPLAVIAGKPAIAYQYGSPFELGYVRALDENGEEWGFGSTIFTNTPAGYHLFLQDISGVPALVYDDDGEERTSIIKAQDADGSSWGEAVVIYDSAEADTGSYPLGVAQIGGMPAVLIKQWTTNRIVLCSAEDAAGTAWGAPTHVTYTLEFSSTSRLLQIESRPGFVSVTGNQLVYSQYD